MSKDCFENEILPAGFAASFSSPRLRGVNYKEGAEGYTVHLAYPDALDLRDRNDIPESLHHLFIKHADSFLPETRVILQDALQGLSVDVREPFAADRAQRVLVDLTDHLGQNGVMSGAAYENLAQVIDAYFKERHDLAPVVWDKDNVLGSRALRYLSHKDSWLQNGEIEPLVACAEWGSSFCGTCFDPALTPDEATRVFDFLLDRNASHYLTWFADLCRDRPAIKGFRPQQMAQATGLLVGFGLEEKQDPWVHALRFMRSFRYEAQALAGMRRTLAATAAMLLQTQGGVPFALSLYAKADSVLWDRGIFDKSELFPHKSRSTRETKERPGDVALHDIVFSSLPIFLSVLDDKDRARFVVAVKQDQDILGQNRPIVCEAVGLPSSHDAEVRSYFKSFWDVYRKAAEGSLAQDCAVVREALRQSGLRVSDKLVP